MSNSIAPGSSVDVNVKVTALTTNPNVPVTYKTIILKKNLVNGVNTLTQEMMSVTNTKYVIKYDYVLEEDITVPIGCILEFDGGSISGEYTITGVNTGIKSNLIKIFNTDATLIGTWNVAEAYPEWFGAVGDGTTDDTLAINKALSCTLCRKLVFGNKTYAISDSLIINNDSQEIIGYPTMNRGGSLGTTITSSSNNYAFLCQKTLVSFGAPKITDIFINAKNGIMLGDTTSVIADGDSTIPYFMKFWFERVTCVGKGSDGIGICVNKGFDGQVVGCNVYNYNIGILFRGTDISRITETRCIINNYHIYDVPYGTFGSQNLILHNDLLALTPNTGKALIKSLSRHVTIIDNYFEHSTGYSIDLTDIDPVSNINYTTGLFTVVIRDNRHDIAETAEAYKILGKGYYSIVIDDRQPVGSKKDNLYVVDNNGNTAKIERTFNSLAYQKIYLNTNNYKYNSSVNKSLENINYIFDSSSRIPKTGEGQYIDANRNIYFPNGVTNYTFGNGYETLVSDYIPIGYCYLCTVKLKAISEDFKATVLWFKEQGGVDISFATTIKTSEWTVLTRIYYPLATTKQLGLYTAEISKGFILAPIEFKVVSRGSTDQRPTTQLYAGLNYYDTNLKKPIWWNGSAWIDATGTTV